MSCIYLKSALKKAFLLFEKYLRLLPPDKQVAQCSANFEIQNWTTSNMLVNGTLLKALVKVTFQN
jgi:hypothetical protein